MGAMSRLSMEWSMPMSLVETGSSKRRFTLTTRRRDRNFNDGSDVGGGETTLENAAQEPEVVDLANFCPPMGAKILGEGNDRD